MIFFRRALTIAVVLAGSFATACKSDSTTAPVAPNPILGFSVVARGSTSVQYTFTTVPGDASYEVQRAEGTTGSFASDTVITAPAASTAITVTRSGLKVNTPYRFRVVTTKGNLQSIPSSEQSASTLNVGNAGADITTDITANRTLFADTVYTLKGFIHVANGATLTIQPGAKIQGDFATVGSSLWICVVRSCRPSAPPISRSCSPRRVLPAPVNRVTGADC